MGRRAGSGQGEGLVWFCFNVVKVGNSKGKETPPMLKGCDGP